jgi:aspartate/methionine/tyrosine aminotransferase
MTSSSLSTRGRKLIRSSALPEYLREHFARLADPEYVPLCVAENKLVSELLLAKMAQCRDVPPSVLGYDAMRGKLELRTALARFLERKFLGRRFAPEQLAVLAGAGTVLEILFHAIADPGDAVLVPTPSYAGFWLDLETRNELHIVPVSTSSDDDFRLTPELLQRALETSPRPVRALLFTSPDNPLGRVYTSDEIRSVRDWASAAGIHLVVDEIYALSVYGERPFTSVATQGSLGERVHVVWALSKDFAASGLRVGVLVSESEEVLAAVDELAYWACCSGDTQALVTQMISDDEWVDEFVKTNQGRLGEAERLVSAALSALGIRHPRAEAGFFVLCDLRRFLAEPTFVAENALWRALVERANVNLTPGAACRVGEPGFMRLCFAGVPTPVAVRAIERVGEVLGLDAPPPFA